MEQVRAKQVHSRHVPTCTAPHFNRSALIPSAQRISRIIPEKQCLDEENQIHDRRTDKKFAHIGESFLNLNRNEYL